MSESHHASIAIQIGAPQTISGQIVWSLRKDAQRLWDDHGVMVHRPRSYRRTVNDLVDKQINAQITEQERSQFITSLGSAPTLSRQVLSCPDILGVPAWMLHGGALFQNAGRNCQALKGLFANNACTYFLALQNPATMIPSVFRTQDQKPWFEFLGGADLFDVSWAAVVRHMRTACPDARFVIWRDEDAPIIWPDILAAITGMNHTYRFSGALDGMSSVLGAPVIQRLQDFLEEHPDMPRAQRLEVFSVFWERLSARTRQSEPVDIPGWTPDTSADLSRRYTSDVALIRDMPGISFLSKDPVDHGTG